jgi:hypothetical protein
MKIMGWALAVLVLVMLPQSAFAVSEVLLTTCGFTLRIWSWIKTAVYVLGAISLAIMSMQASLMGRFSFGQLIGWGGGMFVLAAAPMVISFLTGSGAILHCNLYGDGGPEGGPI